jgi:general secretion pathway protein B
VHAQALPPIAADADAPPASRRWLVISAVLALALLGVVVWQWFGRPELAAPAADAVALRVPMPVTEPAAPPSLPPSPPPGLTPAAATLATDAAAPAAPAAPSSLSPAQSPAAAPVQSPAPIAAPRQAVPMAARVAPPTGAALRNAAPTPTRPAAAEPSPAAPVISAPESSTPEPPPAPAVPARIPMASELPDDVRAGLPTLAIGGASYSQNPESRMLIVNGQVFREGDRLAPDVTLEQIRLKEAVLSARGVRYRIAY